jgi:hypothetical protein
MWEQLESLAQEIKEAWCTAPNREGLGGIVLPFGGYREL